MPAEWKGLPELIRKYNTIADKMPDMLRGATQKAIIYVHSTVPPYPVAPSTSTYTRTGTLGREIHTRVETVGSSSVGIIGTPTVYSPFVISDEEQKGRGPQTNAHRGRWWTLQEVVRRARDVVVDIYLAELRALLNTK